MSLVNLPEVEEPTAEGVEAADSTPLPPPSGSAWSRTLATFIENVRINFLPEKTEEKLLPNEEIEFEITLAWYRHIISSLFFHRFWFWFMLTIVALGTIWALATLLNFDSRYLFIPLGVFVIFALYSLYENLEHRQWRLIKTNARIIIYMPEPDNWPLVDSIELKGTPAVLDSNWSENAFWRVFQYFTGARDIYMSMVPIQFEQGKAVVKGALVFPDMMPDQIRLLKERVFRANK